MSIIGNFKYDSKADTYTGDITTLAFHASNVQFTPNTKASDKEPDYRVIARNGKGTVDVGAAWKKTSREGQAFLSVSIDDPALAAPLNVALFPSEEGETAALVWTRPKKNAKAD